MCSIYIFVNFINFYTTILISNYRNVVLDLDIGYFQMEETSLDMPRIDLSINHNDR